MPISDGQFGARIHVGDDFYKRFPANRADVEAAVSTMLNMGMQTNARVLDAPPKVTTEYGEIPVDPYGRVLWLADLKANPDGRSGYNRKLLEFAGAAEELLVAIHSTWAARLTDVWLSLRRVEALASGLLGEYLAGSLLNVRDARRRYLYPNGDTPRVTSDDFKSLQQGVAKIRALNCDEELKLLREQQAVQLAVTMATAAIAGTIIAAEAGAAVLLQDPLDSIKLDERAWEQVADATGNLSAKDVQIAATVTWYLQVVRTIAKQHPIILVIQHDKLLDESPLRLGRSIAKAADAAETAIGDMFERGVNTRAIPELRSKDAITCSQFAELIQKANIESVWKLPTFLERAMLGMAARDATDVYGILEIAFDKPLSEEIAGIAAFTGLDTVLMSAPELGFAGIPLAVAWVVINMKSRVQKYLSLRALYYASVDPAELLRGDELEPPSAVELTVDLLDQVR